MYKPGEIYEGPAEKVEQSAQPPHRHNLSKEQKIALTVLGSVFFLTFVFWIYRFNRSIHEPFVYKGDDNPVVATEEEAEEKRNEELRSKDTDGDGLSDYDELNIYQTSPYLEDTDSDGFTDGKEIETENNPKCRNGKECESASGLVNADAVPTNSANIASSSVGLSGVSASAQSAFANSLAGASGTPAVGDQAAALLLTGSADAKALRDILVSAGMDKAALDKISDEQLMKSYQEILANKK